tara:strand:- start:1438 stop:1767 length:330 start_codon:yes stop_codon:yes gene_type:complete
MTKELKALIEDLRLNHEYCPKEVILQAADELERLAQPAQEPVCPECKAKVLYECVACSSNNYPPKPKQELLTDKQILAKALHLSGLGTSPDVLQYARAIEAAVLAKFKE